MNKTIKHLGVGDDYRSQKNKKKERKRGPDYPRATMFLHIVWNYVQLLDNLFLT